MDKCFDLNTFLPCRLIRAADFENLIGETALANFAAGSDQVERAMQPQGQRPGFEQMCLLYCFAETARLGLAFRKGECEVSLQLDDAYKRGDLEGLKRLLGDPADFPNCRGPLGGGEIILEYAIYHSPLAFIRRLLELGANPNYADNAGFPSLIAALSATSRADRYDILELLLSFGANIGQCGINDYTPLHYAANIEDIPAMELLIAHGADLNARTHIDDHATPLEEAEILGRKQAAGFLEKAARQKR